METWKKDQARFHREGPLSYTRKDVLYGMVFCIRCLWVSTREGCIREKKKAAEKKAENGIRLCLRPGKYFCENGHLGKVGRQGHRCCTKRLRRYPGPD